MTLRKIQQKKGHEKITMVTAYDSFTASVAENAGIDMILVGDSLANTTLGRSDTLSVTLDEMLHHARAVRTSVTSCPVIFDMPFLSTSGTRSETVKNCGRALQEAGAAAVKIEGPQFKLDTIRSLTENAIPVMGHLGLMPQYVHQHGGMRVQGRESDQAEAILQAAKDIEQAGAFSLVLECVPRELGTTISSAVGIPVIGIGAGADCDGQVLVMADLLGMSPEEPPHHARKFARLYETATDAVREYIEAVRKENFPGPENDFH